MYETLIRDGFGDESRKGIWNRFGNSVARGRVGVILECQLVPALTALDALRSGLPVGDIDLTGNMDTCIALRTLVLQGNQAHIQAGAGIVADSVPESEFHETLNKAKGLLKAINIAERQL